VDFIPEQKWSETPISKVMVKLADLITGPENFTLDCAYKILEREKKGVYVIDDHKYCLYLIGKLPIINERKELTALIARTDLKKTRDFPLSSNDAKGQLRVGAAINTRESAKDAVRLLVNAGVDVIVIVSQMFFIWLPTIGVRKRCIYIIK
jgi:IMP dehydrogenase